MYNEFNSLLEDIQENPAFLANVFYSGLLMSNKYHSPCHDNNNHRTDRSSQIRSDTFNSYLCQY